MDHTISAFNVRQLIKVEDIKQSLDKMRKEEPHRVSANCKKHIAQHSRLTNIVEPSFDMGD